MSKLIQTIPGTVAVATTIKGEPVSKARARVRVQSGKSHSYTPTKTRTAQEETAWQLRAGMNVIGPIADARFEVVAHFYCGNWQRRDVDNLLKLVMDAATGVVWKDDSQVDELHAYVHRGDDSPHTEIEITVIDKPTPPSIDCKTCGKSVRVYPSTQNVGPKSRAYCSRECANKGLETGAPVPCAGCGKEIHKADYQVRGNKSGEFWCTIRCRKEHTVVEATCAACGSTFRRAQSLLRRGARAFCDERCHAAFARSHRAANAVGRCEDCGGTTSKKSYRRCHACKIEATARARELQPKCPEVVKHGRRAGEVCGNAAMIGHDHCRNHRKAAA